MRSVPESTATRGPLGGAGARSVRDLFPLGNAASRIQTFPSDSKDLVFGALTRIDLLKFLCSNCKDTAMESLSNLCIVELTSSVTFQRRICYLFNDRN